MRIKKISPTTPANGNIENQYGTSQTNAYSEAYANTTFATKDVATTSANGLMSSTDKTKLDACVTTTATTSANGLMSSSDKSLLDQLDTKRFATRMNDDSIPDGGTRTFTVTDNGKYIFFNAHPYRTGADFLNIHPNLGLNATNIFGSTTMTYTLNGTTLTIKSEGQCRGWLFVLNMTS